MNKYGLIIPLIKITVLVAAIVLFAVAMTLMTYWRGDIKENTFPIFIAISLPLWIGWMLHSKLYP